MKNHRIGASVLSIPFLHFKETYQNILQAGVYYIHLDIMDGNFVPNLSFSPSIAKELRSLSPSIPFDIHYMVTSLAYTQISQAFLAVHPSRISVHTEVFPKLDELIQDIKEQKIEFGVAMNPDTPIEAIFPYLPQLDFILLMSVNPGFGGQLFNPAILDKAKELDYLRNHKGYTYQLEVDGGIQLSLVPTLAENGIELFVIGSDLVKQQNPEEYVHQFRSLCQPYS